MKVSVKYDVKVDTEIKKELERLEDHLAFKLEDCKSIRKVHLRIVKREVDAPKYIFPCESGEVSVRFGFDVVSYDAEYITASQHIFSKCKASVKKIQEKMRDRYPDQATKKER